MHLQHSPASRLQNIEGFAKGVSGQDHPALSEYTSVTTLIREYETIAAHAVCIGIARWPRDDGLHRARIAGLITIPEGRLTADYAAALRQREQAITAAVREQARAAVTAREPWTHASSR